MTKIAYSAYDDSNGDGKIDYAYGRYDTDGDGYYETVAEAFDDDKDGNFDYSYVSSDTDGDGHHDEVVEYFDDNSDGYADRARYRTDENGDGSFDYEYTASVDDAGNISTSETSYLA
ncbi:hypothetical protein [Phormidium sp. CCY1219]|uniref:hypothetical protein n=1 Tax=Phormidium sp. CCY1219 TaxID=2886104 RepID=UPI002D1EC5B8|nr:hypothetical protein [Phormidium sp. CCY1219]MEB3826126.1 hypothetical protein [Phormidium sp. CCY1219]